MGHVTGKCETQFQLQNPTGSILIYLKKSAPVAFRSWVCLVWREDGLPGEVGLRRRKEELGVPGGPPEPGRQSQHLCFGCESWSQRGLGAGFTELKMIRVSICVTCEMKNAFQDTVRHASPRTDPQGEVLSIGFLRSGQCSCLSTCILKVTV